jgi:hypothetical protein
VHEHTRPSILAENVTVLPFNPAASVYCTIFAYSAGVDITSPFGVGVTVKSVFAKNHPSIM